ncbi:hypothetical protein PUN28_007576 [Cardiocondyla obscurior]
MVVKGKSFEISHQFMKLKTDEERIIFTLNLLQEYNVFPTKTGMPKNAKESEKLREQGNAVFVSGTLQSKTCISALQLYTKSITFAPYPSEQLALGYANRSAVLFQLGLHSECIQDIDRALAINYPDNLRAKLCLRKTECLMILGDRRVENTLEEAQHWLNKMSLSDTNREKLKTKLDTLHNKSVKTVSANKEINAPKSSSLPTFERNDEVPCASSALAVKYNERYGRHVVATRDINPGEVIAVEQPYSRILLSENVQTHCSNCLEVCWANIPCNYCTYAMYCSEKCRDVEWKKCHDIECPVFPALMEYDFYNLDLFSMRLAVFALREAGGFTELRTMLKEVDEHNDPRTKGFSRDGKLHNDRYISVYGLTTNTEKRSVPDLFKRALNTCFILYFIATRTVMFGAKLPEDLSVLVKNNDVTFFGNLILRHQQIIPCNMHTFGELQGLEYTDRGIGALPFLSLFNHSCSANILRHSRSKHEVIYTLYPIRKGEQLLDNYGKHHAIMPKATRQQKLLKQYHFVCDCVPCQEDWPLYVGLQSYKILVSNPLARARIEKALKKYPEYVDFAMVGKINDNNHTVIKDLLEMVKVLYDYAPLPCEEMCNVIETLKRIYDLNFDGNIMEIPQVQAHRK